MKKYRINFKRIITIILALLIQLGSLCITGLPASIVKAESADYGKNLLTGLTPTLYGQNANGSRVSVSNTYNMWNLNDGNPSSEFTLNHKFADYNGGDVIWYEDGTKVYGDIEFDLGASYEVKKLVLTNHTSEQLRTGRFKFYLSETKQDLYNDEKSLIKDFQNTEKAQINEITLDKARSARYFAIRILNPISTKNVSNTKVTETLNPIYPRILELELFGAEAEAYDTNLVTGLTPSLHGKRANGDRVSVSNTYNMWNLNDGDSSSEFTLNHQFADYNGGDVIWYEDGTKVYGDIEFDLGAVCDVKKLVLTNHPSEQLRTGHFKFYLSESKADLYDDSKSLVKDYKNTDKLEINEIVLTEARKARYAAIRILNPISTKNVSNTKVTETINPIYPRIRELELFGKKPEVKVEVESLDYTNSTEALPELTGSDNLIYNREYNKITQMTNGEDTSSNAELKIKNEKKDLTNGIPDTSMFLPGAIYFDENGKPVNSAPYTDSKNYTTISYFLGGEAEVDAVWVYNHTGKSYINYAYAIYISNDRSKLFDKESLVHVYENNANKSLQKFKFKQPVLGQYMGVKFFTPNTLSATTELKQRYLRLGQLAAFGRVTKEGTEEKDSGSGESMESVDFSALYEKYGKNLAKGLQASVQGFDGTNFIKSKLNNSKLTDENLKSEFLYGEVKFAEWNDGDVKYYHDGSRFAEISLDFKYKIKPAAILLCNHSAEAYRTYEFALYASNDLDKLYEEENLIKKIVNTTLDQYVLTECDKREARYIGLRIYKPTQNPLPVTEETNNNYVRITDFAVFGDWANPDEERQSVRIIDKAFIDANDLTGLGKSIIEGNVDPSFYYSGQLVAKPKTYSTRSDVFTDNNLAESTFLANAPRLTTTDGSNTLDIVYTFDKLYDVSGLMFLGINQEYNKPYYTGWYQAYAAEELDDLFLEENRVFEYKWVEGELQQLGHIVNFDNYVRRANYFAIRFLNPVTTATTGIAPRLTEIAVYGEESVIEIKPTNLAKNMPIEAFEVLKSKTKAISDSNLSVKEIKNLTDEDASTFATIKTDASKIQIIYNLCNDALLKKLAVNSNAGGYKIYASDDINKLKDSASLLYTSKKGNDDGITLSGKKAKKKYRYVLFELSGIKDSVKVFELSVIGNDNQLLKYKKVSRNLKSDNVEMRTYNFETEDYGYINFDNKVFERFFDADTKTSNGIYGGKHNEATLDLIITFDDVRNIDRITLDFPSRFRFYSPSKLEIYVSEQLNAFDNGKVDQKALCKFDTFPEKGRYTASFRPRLARIMLVRFVCGDTEYNGYDDYMCFALNEITIEGTPVVGMQPDPDDENLITFTDKKTGISAGIVKYDNNDIFTNAAGIKVTKRKATTEHKISLTELGALKIIDNTIYDVKLLDINGEVLTDLGGRQMKIEFPYNAKKYVLPILALANGNVVESAYSEDFDNKVIYRSYDLNDKGYLLAALASSDDPYFDGLDVEIPDNEIFYPEDPLYDEDELLNNGEDGYYDEMSPATGEASNVWKIAIVMFASALAMCVITYRKKAHR